MLYNDIHNGVMYRNYYNQRKKLYIQRKEKKRLKNTGFTKIKNDYNFSTVYIRNVNTFKMDGVVIIFLLILLRYEKEVKEKIYKQIKKRIR